MHRSKSEKPRKSNDHTHTPESQQFSLNQEQAFLNDLDASLWEAANKLRDQISPYEYKFVVLGLIFLKYTSDSFNTYHQALRNKLQDPNYRYYIAPKTLSPEQYQAKLDKAIEDRDYYTAENLFWVPKQARWENIREFATLHQGTPLPWGGTFRGVAKLIDDAFNAIENENEKLKGIIQRISGYDLSDKTLIGLIDTFSNTHFSQPTYHGKPISIAEKDILGHVYEYFLGKFAAAEGTRGGQFFTPKSIVKLIVDMLKPYKGRVYDPAMGSGGFFVQAQKFIEAHQGKIHDISIFGQEFDATTWKLAAMNMAIRGIDFNFGKRGDSFTDPQHIDTKMDFVMANPPFNKNNWWDESLRDDPRWVYGAPPEKNANFAWIQHMLYHLKPTGCMGVVMPNGSMSIQQNGEGKIRQNLIEADLVEAMVALPSQLFTNTSSPACIWFLNKAKTRKNEVLFIDAREIGYMKDRTLRDFTPEDIAHIANTYHAWQKDEGYQNQAGFCYAANLEEICQNDFVLTPGRYVGIPESQDDDLTFAKKMQTLTALLNEQFEQGRVLEEEIKKNLGAWEYL